MMLPLGAGGINEGDRDILHRAREAADGVGICRIDRPAFAFLGRVLNSARIVVFFDMKMLSGPSESKNVTMPARNPVSSDATVTTVVMPITMPRMVRPERNRCVQTADIAIVMFSFGEIFIRLLTQPSAPRSDRASPLSTPDTIR